MFYLGKVSHAYEYVFYCTQCTQLHTKSYITDIQYVIYILSCVQNKKNVCKTCILCAKQIFVCGVCAVVCKMCAVFPACMSLVNN